MTHQLLVLDLIYAMARADQVDWRRKFRVKSDDKDPVKEVAGSQGLDEVQQKLLMQLLRRQTTGR